MNQIWIKDDKDERERKVVLRGELNYSFGKNGQGLTDELLEIGDLIHTLSKDNHVYIKETFIDTLDDVYDIKFTIIPHEENSWMLDRSFNGPETVGDDEVPNDEPLEDPTATPLEITPKVREGIE